jgi:hypothetical protein
MCVMQLVVLRGNAYPLPSNHTKEKRPPGLISPPSAATSRLSVDNPQHLLYYLEYHPPYCKCPKPLCAKSSSIHMTEHDSSGSLLLSAPEGPGCISFVSLHASIGINQREKQSAGYVRERK